MNLTKIQELVNIKSYSLEENTEIINYLINEFKPYSKEIIKVKNMDNNKYNLIVGLNTEVKNTKALILSGHIDTVVADEKAYNTNPYEATLIENKLYGLGVIDMKCFFACILNNIEILSKQTYPIIIVITSDEETTLNGIDLICDTLKSRNVTPVLSIIGEPTQMCVCTKSKSCYEYEINILGKSCHSSNPNNGINSIYIAANIILFIEKLNLKYQNTTLSCGVITGGEKVNIVPNVTQLRFDLRSNKKQNVNKIIKEINKQLELLKKKYKGCQIYLKELFAIPALEKKEKKGIADYIISKYSLKEKEFVGGCEAGYLQQLGGEAFLFGVGDLSLAHKPNEFLDINEYKNYSNLFCKIIKELPNNLF